MPTITPNIHLTIPNNASVSIKTSDSQSAIVKSETQDIFIEVKSTKKSRIAKAQKQSSTWYIFGLKTLLAGLVLGAGALYFRRPSNQVNNCESESILNKAGETATKSFFSSIFGQIFSNPFA